MTVDYSQVTRRDVIILEEEQQQQTAPAVLVKSSVDGERGVVEDAACICDNRKKVSQSQYDQAQKLATALDCCTQQQQPSPLNLHQEVNKLPISKNNSVEDISDDHSDTTSAASSINSDDDMSDVASTTESSNEMNDDAAVAMVDEVGGKPQQQQQAQGTVPKWVRVGEKVCFSTVVAAVLIPSSHDLTAFAKRELWWQSTDYADFRVNYATHMHDPSIELREQEREESTGSAPAVPVGSKADTPSDSGTTATAEGVLVVAASPAPAPLASRSVNPTVAPPRRAGGGGWHAGGGSHKVGGCGGGGVAVPSQDRPSKSYCHERNMRQQQQQAALHKNVQGRRRMGGRPGFATPHHAAHMMPQQYTGMQPLQQQHQQVVMMQRGHPGLGNVAGVGRREARREVYNMPPRVVSNDMSYHQQHHNRRAVPGGHHGQQQQPQFFVNCNPAGVNCPPPPQQHRHRQQQQRHQSRVGAVSAASPSVRYHGSNNNGNGPALVQAFVPAQAVSASGFRGGVSMAPAAFSSRGGCGGGMGPRPAAGPSCTVGGGGHMPVTVPVAAANQSQFSMWRSQLVFAPVMHMQ